MRGGKIGGRPSVPDPDAPPRGSSARPPNSILARAGGNKLAFYRPRTRATDSACHRPPRAV
jgi:hypothetical protein